MKACESVENTQEKAPDRANDPAAKPAPKKRIEWLDIAKGVGIILVIFGHTLASGSTPWRLIYSFHMPLFFILAGFTFRVKPWKVLVPSKAKRLLLPFLVTFILGVVTTSSWLLHDLPALGRELLYCLAYQPKQIGTWFDIPYIGVIWFLMCMFVACMWLNALLKVFARFKLPPWAEFVIMLAFGYAGVVIGRRVLLPFDIDIAMTAALFMYLGYAVKTYNLVELISRWWVSALCAVLWCVSVQFSSLEMSARDYTMFPLALVAAAAASVIVIKMSQIVEVLPKYLGKVGQLVKQYLTFMGKSSMLIFCIHYLEYPLINWNALPVFEGWPLNALWAFLARWLVLSLLAALPILV